MMGPKSTLLAPITALEVVDLNEGNFVVYVGTGGEIRSYRGDQCNTVEVFDHHSVHGVRVCPKHDTLVGFGDKSVVLLQLDSLSVKRRLDNLCDMVLDCCLVSQISQTSQKTFLIIGFAHNFVDILELPPSTPPKFVRRVMGPAPCVLFSLNFSSADIVADGDQQLLVASGNVFGAISWWECPVDVRDAEKTITAPSKAVVDSHEGVIFKTRWNADKTLLVSVADDRTVRVYDVLATPPKEIFVGWGHVSRVWDAVFIESMDISRKPLVASSSEDGSIRIWNISTATCLACVKGHNADVWRLCAVKRGAILLSGGNDGAVKAWNVLDALSASPAEAASTLQNYHFAEWKPMGGAMIEGHRARTAAVADGEGVVAVVDGGEGGLKNQTRRLNGTSGLRVSSDHAHVVIVLCNGSVWMVDREREKETSLPGQRESKISPPSALGNWTQVNQLGHPVNCMDATFFPSFTDHGASHCLVSCAHPDGHVTILLLSTSNSETSWKVDALHCWKAHTYRCTATYVVSADTSGGGYPCIATTSIKGECRLWCLEEQNTDYGIRMELSCRAGGDRAEMVTAVGLVQGGHERHLLLGDKRGGVSVYVVPSLSADERKEEEEEQEEVRACQYFHRTHGGECVSCFAVTEEGFVTGGADATLRYYRYSSLPSPRAGAEEQPMGRPLFIGYEHTYLSSCLPVTLPATLVHQGNALYVIGFHADHLLVADLTHSVVLMRVEGGSWRRPSDCKLTARQLGLPGVLFVSVAPRGNRDSLLQVCACGASPSLFRGLLWDRLSISGAGRVNYGATFLHSAQQQHSSPSSSSLHFVVGGEEGQVRLYRGDSLQLVTDLPYSAKIKALSFASTGPGRGVLVATGSRLTYRVWAWREGAEGEGVPPSCLTALQAGSVESRATQEHRILSMASLSEGRRLLFVLGDSRGYAFPLTVGDDDNEQTVQLHEPLRPSSFPVLSCSLCTVPCWNKGDVSHHGEELTLAAFGSSSGQVALSALSVVPSTSRLLLELPMHSMGTNGVALSLIKLPQSEGEGEGEQEPVEGALWRAIIVTGGDDQACCVASVLLGRGSSSLLTVVQSALVRIESVAGAALKGVCLWETQGDGAELSVVTLAADQRVQRWSVLPEKIKGDTTLSSPFSEGSPLQWRSGLVTNITDPQCLARGAHIGQVLVAGEGTQILQL